MSLQISSLFFIQGKVDSRMILNKLNYIMKSISKTQFCVYQTNFEGKYCSCDSIMYFKHRNIK
jgi:hypothetical protein